MENFEKEIRNQIVTMPNQCRKTPDSHEIPAQYNSKKHYQPQILKENLS